MTIAAIIPARLASTRLPDKPLLAQTGKYLIQHVVEQVQSSNLFDMIVVATDHASIVQAVESFGGRAVLTDEAHASGTDRLAEAAKILGLSDADIVVNIQGDEPDIPVECMKKLVDLISDDSLGCEMATLATELPAEQADNPNRVKVVLDNLSRALYFSRSAIPFDRDGSSQPQRLLHLGAYAYSSAFLRKFAQMDQTPLEKCEKLEQLRVLENGFKIAVGVVDYDGNGIDTPEDYAAFVKRAGGN